MASTLLYEAGVHRSKGELDSAIVAFSKALELDPSSFSAYNNRGLTFLEKKRYQDAIGDFTAAIGCPAGRPRAAARRAADRADRATTEPARGAAATAGNGTGARRTAGTAGTDDSAGRKATGSGTGDCTKPSSRACQAAAGRACCATAAAAGAGTATADSSGHAARASCRCAAASSPG